MSFFGWKWLSSVAQRRADVIMPGPAVLFLSLGAWVAEAILVRQAAMWAGINLSWSEALLVTTVSVAAQIAAIAPGGFGTYEAAAVAAYVVLGYDAKPALIAALGAHALKTAYSILVGVVAVFTPAPAFIGRFRLGKVNQLDTNPVLDADAPILLFMPAYNEEEAVAECIERVPPRVLDRPVEVWIVDDGSVASTVDRARYRGAVRGHRLGVAAQGEGEHDAEHLRRRAAATRAGGSRGGPRCARARERVRGEARRRGARRAMAARAATCLSLIHI